MLQRLLIVIGLLVVGLGLTTQATEEKTTGEVRKSVLAGSWYPGDPSELQQSIDAYLSNVRLMKIDAVLQKRIIGMVVPHAGHIYSGQNAAHSYRAIKDQVRPALQGSRPETLQGRRKTIGLTAEGKDIKRVFIIGPNHTEFYFQGVAVSGFKSYQTPLGLVEVDQGICQELLKSGGGLFSQQPQAEQAEHSLEIELPFLQRALSGFKIIPLIAGEMRRDDYKTAAEIIKRFINDKTLIIASSDFTHFGNNYGYVPFKDNIKENIRKLDDSAIKYILAIDPDGFLKYKYDTGTTICGYRPITMLLEILPRDARGYLLDYYTSGDITNDFTNSVSYASIVFTPAEGRGEKSMFKLTKEEEKTLLTIARDTLRLYLKDGKTPDLKGGKYQITPDLNKELGVFVTLHKGKELRGCIGEIFGTHRPLYEGVVNYAIQSATGDPRFMPMTLSEEKEVTIEISVLSPLERINSADEIVVGKHGVYLVQGRCAAVFLPQVAPEQGWDRKTMLEHLCMKAGLSPDAWQKKGTEFYVFTAHVFGE